MHAKRGEAIACFRAAYEFVLKAGFGGEVEWQRSVQFSDFRESELLREGAWVILCSGFREETVRRRFDFISLAFCDWESAKSIVDAAEPCIEAAASAFDNRRKLNAIVAMAQAIVDEGFELLKDRIVREPIDALRSFPYLGPVTARHLAKNLGADVAKPDRHLARLSHHFGYADASALCQDIAEVTQETVRVVDVILWRYVERMRGIDNLLAQSYAMEA